MQAFVPKNRRPKFDLTLRIHDLNNVPLVSGTSFVKWHLTATAAAEHSGRTSKCQIRDHKVSYDYEKYMPVRLTIERNAMLQECPLHFDIFQEYAAGSRGEQITLGRIRLNLAEYCDAHDDGSEDGLSRRYLMQDSKINSTLRIGIAMHFVEGDRSYIVPPLKSAPAFGGIARIMAGEQDSADDGAYMPSLSTKSKEHHEYQDMYRRNLAAFWTAQPGELKADECIEDIFDGGDGWAKHEDPNHPTATRSTATTTAGRRNSHTQPTPNAFGNRSAHSPAPQSRYQSRSYNTPSSSGVSGRASLEQHANNMKAEAEASQNNRSYEVDEFNVREDLRSWKLSEP